MDEQTVGQMRKTFKYKLNPTPKQERAMAFVLRRCRERYNAALEERRDAWLNCEVSVTVAGQSSQLPAVKEVCQRGAARLPRHPLAGLAGCAHPAGSRVSSLLP